MTNLNRLSLEMNDKEYFNNTREVYDMILNEHGLDPQDEYEHANDHVALMECVYSVLQMLANNLDGFCKIETEFVTKSAAYAYLQKRLADIRSEINRAKNEAGTADRITSYMFFNGR